MCGRYTLKTLPFEILQQLALFRFSFSHPIFSRIHPRYNIAPNQRVLVIRGATMAGELQQASTESVEVSEMQWGRPFASGQQQQSVINTRIETLEDKQQFQSRSKITVRPCLIIADGYYEWKKSAAVKIPYYIYREDRRLLLFAGTWQSVRYAKKTPIDCCTIVTCPATGPLDQIHDRMPLFTDPQAGMDWLYHPRALARCRSLLNSCSGDPLQKHTVHTRVNRVGFEHPSCVEPVTFHKQNPLF